MADYRQHCVQNLASKLNEKLPQIGYEIELNIFQLTKKFSVDLP